MEDLQTLLDEAYVYLMEDSVYQAYAKMQEASERWIIALCEKFAIQWQSLTSLERIDQLAKHTTIKKQKLKVMFEWYFVSTMFTHRQSIHVPSLVRCLEKLEIHIREDVTKQPSRFPFELVLNECE